ncbi:CDP-glycerol glycerophosphotransferase family protein [Arthrobacter antioxidans]|uniref:CDP-glycerol glycerophosphotransferase family protein n=1 Tax=Arthrobacter antioxidans TaxID=2895818 RepID=UPI001FFFD087|nr:CDP-glycerol glycerophosphotransferase family protein [Arthrobacter antioxidans]
MTNGIARHDAIHHSEGPQDWVAVAEVLTSRLAAGSHISPDEQFELGHAQFHLGNLESAAQHLTAGLELDPSNPRWHYRLGYIREKQGFFTDAREQYSEALRLQPDNERWEHRLASVATAAERQQAAERAELAKSQAIFTERRLLLKERKAPKWQEIDVLAAGKPFFKEDPEWHSALADALFFMNRHAEAAENYAAAARLTHENAQLHFRAGWAYHLAGSDHLVDRHFTHAIAADKELQSSRLGIGAFFQKKGQWLLAATHYQTAFRHNPSDAELAYHWGFALQRCYDWQGGANAIRTAIALDPSQAQWHYRLGFSLERSADWAQAAEAYSYALAISSSPNEYWSYRLGCVLANADRFEESCIAFLGARAVLLEPPAQQDSAYAGNEYLRNVISAGLRAARSAQSWEQCVQFAQFAERNGDLETAAEAYRAATQRSEKHQPPLYFSLGTLLYRLGRFKEATAALRETRLLKRPHGVNTAPYFKDVALRQSMIYVEYLETLPIREDVILYESSQGNSIGCNPLNIFRTLLKDDRFATKTHVWVINDRTKIPDELRSLPNVIFAARDTDLYLRYLASAAHLLNNNTFPPYFSRRPEQKYLNTWHGTPMKSLGRDIKDGFMDHRNATRNFLHTTHLLAPNEFTAQMLLDKYEISALFDGRVAVTGYPRVDATIGLDQKLRTRLRARLGIDPTQKVILYAPTWRGSLADRRLDNDQLLADLNTMASIDARLLFRGHPVTEAQLDEAGVAAHLVPANIDTNDLLAIVDVLVTDYSSVAFDFMATGRPVLYYAYDLEEYHQERGLCLDITELPGELCRNAAELRDELQRALRREPVNEMKAGQFVGLECGKSSARAVEFFFFGATDWLMPRVEDKRKTMLMYQGSFIPNGITSSYLNLTSHLDPTDTQVYVAIEPSAISSDERRQEKFDQNPQHVRVLPRVGGQLIGAEERWIVDKFNAQSSLQTDEQWEIYHAAFAREFRRMYGTACFDAIVCFEGYARFWAALFAAAPSQSSTKSIFLHNDMHSEWLHRFRYLESMFRLYPSYDSLISVTESVSQENKLQLAERFGLDPEKFHHSNNLVNADATIELSQEPVPEAIEQWIGNCASVFVTAGRLSPEKDHTKLLESFALLVATHEDVKLIILGDGPLRGRLERQIGQLGITSKVLLAGLLMNPFPVIQRASCFIFSSNYEGQGLAVLEALILGKPVISTDVVGPRSILGNDYGLLVDNSVEGLWKGMTAFLDSWPGYMPFDYAKYETEALRAFTNIALEPLREAHS